MRPRSTCRARNTNNCCNCNNVIVIVVKLTNLHENLSIYSWTNAYYKCLKIVHLFLTYSLLLFVTSVNTYMSVMGFSMEGKYLIKPLQENKKYGAKWYCLKCFLTTRKPRKGAAVIAAGMHGFAICRKFKSPVTLTLTLDRVKVSSTYTVYVGLLAYPTMWL